MDLIPFFLLYLQDIKLKKHCMKKVSIKISLLLLCSTFVGCNSNLSTQYFDDLQIINREAIVLMQKESALFEKMTNESSPAILNSLLDNREEFNQKLIEEVKSVIKTIRPNIIGNEIKSSQKETVTDYTVISNPKISDMDDKGMAVIISFKIKTNKDISYREIFCKFTDIAGNIVFMDTARADSDNGKIAANTVVECNVLYPLHQQGSSLNDLNMAFSMNELNFIDKEEYDIRLKAKNDQM